MTFTATFVVHLHRHFGHFNRSFYLLTYKKHRFKQTCNDENDIGHKKRQNLAYHIFTCKFPVSSLH